jgi:hypothetical protein
VRLTWSPLRRRRGERFGRLGGRWTSTLSLVSAVVVTILGAGIAARGLVAPPLPA